MPRPGPRLPDHIPRLYAWADRERRVAMAWGLTDCLQTLADAIGATTGIRPRAETRGTYRDAEGAEAMLEAEGGLEAVIGAVLGEPLASSRLACDGDAAAVEERGGLRAGVVFGADVLLRGDEGLVRRNLARASLTWAVGR